MTDTATLIAQLSNDTSLSRPARSPIYWGVRLFTMLAIYAVGAQCFLGVRPDLSSQWAQPFYVAEVALLALLAISSIVAGILAMYPDSYQRPKLRALPYGLFTALALLLGYQIAHADTASFALDVHAMECASCIAMVAMIPSALMFVVLRKGATIHPLQAGAFAVLAASAIGCLIIRLEEVNASFAHLVIGHYVPTLLFAAIGAAMGRWLLKW